MIHRRISTEKRGKNTPCYLLFLKLSFSVTTLILFDVQLLFLEIFFALSCVFLAREAFFRDGTNEGM